MKCKVITISWHFWLLSSTQAWQKTYWRANSSVNWMYTRLPGITLDLVMGYYNLVGWLVRLMVNCLPSGLVHDLATILLPELHSVNRRLHNYPNMWELGHKQPYQCGCLIKIQSSSMQRKLRRHMVMETIFQFFSPLSLVEELCETMFTERLQLRNQQSVRPISWWCFCKYQKNCVVKSQIHRTPNCLKNFDISGFLEKMSKPSPYIKMRTTANPTADMDTRVPMQYLITSYFAASSWALKAWISWNPTGNLSRWPQAQKDRKYLRLRITKKQFFLFAFFQSQKCKDKEENVHYNIENFFWKTMTFS